MSILFLFILWRTTSLFISFIAPRFIPYLGFFPYGYVLEASQLPKFIYSLANFDGAHYILIARNGYSQWEQAFFPLYPLLIRFLSPVFGNNHLATGLAISNICFLIGLIVFGKYLKLINPNDKIQWILIFLLIFPASFFFGAVYTEGLFFLLLVCSLYLLEKERYCLTAICGYFAALTRTTGIFLVIPFIIKIYKNRKLISKNMLHVTCYMLYIFSPILGLLSYCLYLWKTTGDPFFFFNSQPIFGANRSTKLILLPQVIYRYLKILLTATADFRYFISLFELATFCLVFGVLLIDLWRIIKNKVINYSRLGLNIFSLTNIILPTLTGTFSSIPRYSLLSLSFFIALARIKSNLIKTIIATVFMILNIIMLGLFAQGYFVS